MRLVNTVCLVVVLLLAGGCASVPMTSASLDAEGKKFTPEPGKGSIYIYRGSGLVGTPLLFETMLDARVAGFLAKDTYLLLSVLPGQHTLTIVFQQDVRQQKVLVEADKTYFFEVGVEIGWLTNSVRIQPVNEEEGRRGVMGTKRAEAMTYE